MTMPDDTLRANLPAHRLPPILMRATSHARGRTRIWLLTMLLGVAPACEKPSGEPGPSATNAELESRIEALRAAYVPIALDKTGDKINAWNLARRELQEELERGSPALGAVALAAFQREVQAKQDWRMALLGVAAHCNSEHARPVLENLSVIFDGVTPLGVRTEAMRLLCATSPASAAKLFEPILLEQRPSVTYPPKEQMLRHWVGAARAVHKPIDETLASIAIDIAQPADARGVAVEELGKEPGSLRGRKALETVLVESSSDGLLRRKAAQALRNTLPRAELCPLLERVAQNESDPAFLNFLADLLIKNCQ